MNDDFIFPFGQPLQRVEQTDRRPKKVFILGVYGSAVHARWLDPAGRTLVKALAVASEPRVFWNGSAPDAAGIIAKSHIPPKMGTLVPADETFNGPSGQALDDLYLTPLGFPSRDDAWLCDLVPHTCLNLRQQQALQRYHEAAQEFGLAPAHLPTAPPAPPDAARREEVLQEIEAAQPRLIIPLGDQPLLWFLSFFQPAWERLAGFGKGPAEYGRVHECRIQGKRYHVLPLVHPRQAGGLGLHSPVWKECHAHWARHEAGSIRHEYLGD